MNPNCKLSPQDEKIISVTPVPEYFSLTWMLGSRCNYDCMYCPTELHDSTSQPHDLKTMQQVWQNIYNKTQHKNLPYKISFTGGEVTANKNFLPLVQWLKDTYPDIEMILLTTNGSASQQYYKKLAGLVTSISFSTHSEYMDEKKFFDTVLAVNQVMIRPAKSVHVNIMNERWNQDRIKLYQQWLGKHNISYSINQIDYATATRIHVLDKGKKNLAI
jgi:molybdenum cofactor biosynthesis enzyme MoaA